MISKSVTGITRFFLGLGFGAVLTVFSFGFVGIGHGTSAPLFLTNPAVELPMKLGAVPTLLVGPALWALYFLFIPRIQKKSTRMTVTMAILFIHLLAGTWVAIDDPAFSRVLVAGSARLVLFALVLLLTMACLLYFAATGSKRESTGATN